MNPEKIALFDMDGTLCDFTGQIMRDLTLLRSPNEPEVTIASIFDPPEWLDRRMTLIKNVRGWWKNLPRLEDGFRILDLAVQIGFTPQVLTKGPFRTSGKNLVNSFSNSKNSLDFNLLTFILMLSIFRTSSNFMSNFFYFNIIIPT